MTTVNQTEEETCKNKTFYLVEPRGFSLDNVTLLTSEPDGIEWNYETDGEVEELTLEVGEEKVECKGIKVKGASYILLYNHAASCIWTKRTDYEELAKIVQRATICYMN